MTPPLATVRVGADGDIVHVAIKGEIDLSNASDIEGELADAISNHVTGARVDLDDVTYIDSVGMRVFFKLVTQLRTAQIGLTLVAAHGSPARRVMEVSGLIEFADVQPA